MPRLFAASSGVIGQTLHQAIVKRTDRTKGGAVRSPTQGNANGGIRKAVYQTNKKKTAGVDDLTLLSKISDEDINANLELRFKNGEIYTYIGHVLISVNPFRDLGIYTMEVLQSYQGKNRLEVPPHVYAIAESAYYQMNAYKENQCIIISGESGAGKTEAAKRIMQYITHVSKSVGTEIEKVSQIILATNPLLESFGCAKTLRNNNSSRHGKYLEMIFNQSGIPIGAKITNYLLEKNRVVHQIRNERNFHIFYQLTKAAPQKYREMFGIQGPENYYYTSMSNCLSVDGISDENDFSETIQAMEIIGLSEEEQDNIFRLLATILWLGNIRFQEGDSEGSVINDESVVQFVAYLLGSDAAAVQRALTVRIMETSHGGRRGSVYEVPLNPTQATAVRDALSMGIYNCLFDWIVERVNKALVTTAATASNSTIGILDIYGFEIFDKNSFEQLCINYVNEKLQQIFIQLTLKAEQEEYVREKIQWSPIKYFNNQIVCDLIESKRPPGIFAAMNDAIATAHADSSAADNAFSQRLNFLSSNPHFEQRQSQFIIKHYAGDVAYSLNGMTDKNKDVLATDILNLVHSTDNMFLRNIFPENIDTGSKRRPPTAGDRIKKSANELVDTLMQCHPSYIRTIKPNQTKSPNDYDSGMVLHQIKYLGLQENVRIRRAGFAYRQSFEKFAERFYLLSGKTSYAGDYTWTGDAFSACEQILKDTSIPTSEYQMGTSKVFIKKPETLFALEEMRDKYWHTMATRIQRAWRSYARRRNDAAKTIQKLWNRNKVILDLIRVRDEGTKLLQGRKERRRFSMLGSRRFYGDYLSVAKSGSVLMKSCGLNRSDKVLFSMRCEVLVHKLGRSSKPSPRQLVVSDKTVFLVITKMTNGQIQQVVEKQFHISSISSINMTSLQDDWLAIRSSASTTGDMFIHCFYKTELVTTLKNVNHGIEIHIGSTLQYCRKPGKIITVKTVKDEGTKDNDYYKSSTIHVGSGLPPNSKSKPYPTRSGNITFNSTNAAVQSPPKQVRPQTRPQARPQTAAPARAPVPAAKQSAPAANNRRPRAPAAPVQNSSRPAPAPVPVAATAPAPAAIPPPPPPPPVAAASPPKPVYTALYDFAGRSANEMSFNKGDVLDIIQKEPSGWWLASRNGIEGWVPANYFKEEMKSIPTSNAVSTPLETAQPSAVSVNSNADVNNLAGSLADALRLRATAVRGNDDEDEEEDW
ncbi:myosin type I [Schizosaccharomyces japonicus yFS275]|uniref:Myosin type I n=1 Tax=Schizosaccharomyces japonicus (strain yFS275 / FY16936) TaxID=402676 RepID=B6K5M5_SCHJY|nr:myosin type I [Schizosaccharomyces japonicus yFS275]EEB08829.1 myosin type I [Schizosaccharomyces japonicus yFS275]